MQRVTGPHEAPRALPERTALTFRNTPTGVSTSARDKAVGLVGSKRPAPYRDSDSHSLILPSRDKAAPSGVAAIHTHPLAPPRGVLAQGILRQPT